MALTQQQTKFLKAQAHHLDPVVTIGKRGLTESIVKELDSSIEHHELLKVKLNAGDTREAEAQGAADAVKAELVQVVGRVAVLFRQRTDGTTKFKLPRD
ncbi:MAG: ribosome assembly RNA-binding protein YhbY [Succinivibrionaceae bacterium]|nr:ribosome assembly RNA-binding protein YhbY [Succinivibrionaceae bacterium]